MAVSRKRFQVHAISFGATACIRFTGGTILAAALIFCGSVRGQTIAADPSGNAFTNTSELIPTGVPGDAALPSAPAAIVTTPLDQSAPYEPITGRQRLDWGIKSAIWPEHLTAGMISAAWGTAFIRPREDGPHWGGFSERFGVRLTGVATHNVIEAGFGALWGEDPRYFRAPELSYRSRIWNAMRMAFMARRPDGHYELAYARFIAIPGNNFLTNLWRPDSEANVHDAVLRSLEGVGGRMISNAWNEFWPDAKSYIFHRGDRQP